MKITFNYRNTLSALPLLASMVLIHRAPGVEPSADAQLTTRAAKLCAGLPLCFQANHELADPREQFFGRGNGYAVHLCPTQAVISFASTAGGHDGLLGG